MRTYSGFDSRTRWIILGMLAPACVLWVILVAWPLSEMVRLSFVKTNYITETYVELANYARILRDPVFLRAVANSLWYILILVPLTTGSALALTMVARDLSEPWKRVARLILYIPLIAAGLIMAQAWKWVYHIDGPLNWLIGLAGAEPVVWMRRGFTAIPAVSLPVAAGGMGGIFIIFLAATTAVDAELYDAAKIDGASRRQIAWKIVFPAILPIVLSMALVNAIAAPQVFENIYALGPYEHVATVGFAIYQEAFVMSRHGTAAAMSVLLMAAMMGLGWIRTRLSR